MVPGFKTSAVLLIALGITATVFGLLPGGTFYVMHYHRTPISIELLVFKIT